MDAFPHHYVATANCDSQANPQTAFEGMKALEVAAPPQFGGPGGFWSPEQLLISAVSTCFILSFKAIARASQLEWISVECDVTGTLDKPERAVKFTHLKTRAKLVVAEGVDIAKAQRLLQKAEETCLVSNSLNAEGEFEAEVVVA